MLKENKKLLMALCLSSIACLIWGYNYILARQIAPVIKPLDICFWRWVIGIAVLYPFARPHFKEGIPKVKENMRIYFYMGLLSICIYNVLFFTAAHFTTANNIAVLGTTSFIWTILVVAIAGIERITSKKIIACLLASSGALVVISKGYMSNLALDKLNWGDLMMLVACMSWGIYSVLVKKRPHQLNQCFFLFVIACFGLAALTPIYLIHIYVNGLPEMNLNSLMIYLYIGVMVSAVAWACYNYSIEVIGPIRTSVFFYSLPVIVAILSTYILDEHIQGYHVAGFLLVVSGIIISNLKNRNERE
jgi:drug/metabolite transporter (DMT)-like permease